MLHIITCVDMIISNALAYLKHLLPSLLQKCSSSKDLKSLHATILKNNYHHDCFIINQFLAACSRLHQIDHAFLAFTQIAEPNIFVYNAMIGCFINCSSAVDALHLFVEMPKLKHQPTCHTFSHLIKACTHIPAIGFGEGVHGQVRKNGLVCHLILQTGLIDFYCIVHRIEDSRKVFDEMIVKDAFSWNTMIVGYTLFGDLNAARKIFDEMPERNTVSWNAMIAGYARSGDVESATSLFNQMHCKNLISWTSMISCYSQNRLFMEALETFDAMKAAGMNPDKVTMATVISACAHLGALEIGRRMHRQTVLSGFAIDVYMGSALIDMYAKCGSLEKSLVIFFKLENKNLFCWNSAIDGLAMHGRPKDAFYMLSKMIENREKPNGVTFVSILSACNHSGLVEEGRRMFHRMVEFHSIEPEMEHYSCMVDLLARAGLLQEALDLTQKMVIVPNSVIWGALLSGCKIHGNMEVGQIAMERLTALDPSKSSSYMLLVDMYAKENRWTEVAAVRGKMKEMGVQKMSSGCSWIEMDGLVHEFAATDTSHPSSEEIILLLFELFGHMKHASFIPDIF
ncbi:pentatricopeptide repeat-containing protein At1g06143 isoform X1 [Dendrobium catenatum]|uniref:pentatricopeptide repeat-containing protein At1g06143 isoform X1 n=1 Tax=Dendrobium catenatum TaxID=906689 RepID=UPI0010A08F57|nr:pentatricopeptide repeat-containing protein At1g06143 isoform X1 [Dendrobium catenatum]